jgi:dienelactone hydrolase
MNHARSDALRNAVGLVLFVIASPGLGQQNAHFQITPDSVLIDDRFRVALEGLEPRKEVTIRVDGNRGVWHSSATFRSVDRGHVEVADPMRLMWSATGDRPGAAVAGPWTLPGGYAGGLASHGYLVFALAYFNAEGLPPFLQNTPLEYFATAVEWLKSQPAVDATRIGVFGTSRGGELALLLGATYPSAFRVVVANVPSNVVWPGLGDHSEAPAWTLNGKPLAAVRGGRFTPSEAEIPVERLNGPLLMFSGKDDKLWPSDVFAAHAVERLKAHHFAHPVEHYSYEHAGHQITRPFVPTSDVGQVRIHPITKRPNVFGGTPEGQAKANEDSWGKLLAFVEKYLRTP